MLQYNDASTYNGIIQAEERLVYSSDYGRISGNTKELAQWTVRNNQALKRATALMLHYQNSWPISDWNDGAPLTGTENIVSGTREVALTNPQDILFIYKVVILQDASTSDYTTISPVDMRKSYTSGFWEDNASSQGVPFRYYKQGGYIVLDPTPNYSATDGLKYYYQGTPHDFTTSDTTQTAAIPSLFDQLIPFYAVDAYATENTNPNLKALVQGDIERMENDIKNFFNERAQDEPARLSVKQRPVR